MRVMTSAYKILRVLAAAAIAAAPVAAAYGQGNPFMPKMSLGGGDKKKLTPEEQEKKQQLDDAYKSATNKIPDQKPSDPWAGVRTTPNAPATAPKKNQQ
jgi:hypothetical protein